MEQTEFYQLAMQPGFGDEMIFEVTSNDPTPGHTFSMGAMDSVAEQIKNFMLARIVAREDAGYKLPKRMVATVRVDFDGMPASEREYGFYTAHSGEEFLEIDGLRRLRGVDKPPS